MKLLIKGGHVVDPKNNIDEVCDVFIDKGIICDVGNDIELDDIESVEVIDATGKYVTPGLVDMHVHLRDPGFTYKEDIESGTKAAALGGVTSVACMPNTNPVCDNVTVVEYIKSKAKQVAAVNVYPIAAITKGLQSEELAPIGSFKFAGVVAISDDGKPVKSAGLMRRALEYADMFDVTVISHCEEMSIAEGYMNEGAVATELGLKGISNCAEEIMVNREINLAENTGTAVHIAHISTKGSVEAIRQAKQRGVRVTCETCPHYFTLTEEAVRGYNTNAKMNPPLRTDEDVKAIIEGLVDGTIDAIATDHAPHHLDEKNCEFDIALNGIIGLETSLGLSVKYLVNENMLSMSDLIRKMSLNPSNILGLSKGSLSVGASADVIIFDAQKEYTVDVTKFASKSKNSPYDGFVLCAKPEYTIVNGEIKVNRGELV
ncbi:MAG: dihydroorotase [Eubacteriales bacterium]|nr:dihydroorotase [Eubacteriales bacterium]